MPHQCTTCGHVFDDGSKEMLSGCPDCGGNTFQFHPKGTEIPETPPDADPPEPEGSTAANTVGRAATKVRDFVSSDDGTDPDPAAGAPEQPPADGSPERASADTSPTGRASAPTSGAEPAGSNSEANGSKPSGSTPDPNATWPSERGAGGQEPELETDDDGIIDADAREAARAVGEADEGADDAASADAGGTPARERGPAAGSETGAPEARSDTTADGPDTTADGPDTGAGPVSGARNAGGVADDGPSDGRVVSEPDGDQPDISELREQLNDQFESIKILEPGQYELNLMELYDREEYIIALQENGRYVIQVPEQWLGDQPGDA